MGVSQLPTRKVAAAEGDVGAFTQKQLRARRFCAVGGGA
jgi:hypothetical protein